MEGHRFCPLCGGNLIGADGTQVCAICGRVHYRDPKVGVGVVVWDSEGRVLLVRRSINPGKGRWSLPAGFMDADETPRAAAARECLEETGLTVDVGALVGLHDATGATAFFLSFAATITDGQLAAGDDADQARFFRLDELPPLAFDSTLAAVSGDGA